MVTGSVYLFLEVALENDNAKCISLCLCQFEHSFALDGTPFTRKEMLNQ